MVFVLLQFVDTVSYLFPVDLSSGGSWVIAVSASRARFCIQFLGLECKLYFRPFCSRADSLFENVMSVLFMSLEWKVCVLCGILCCVFSR